MAGLLLNNELRAMLMETVAF